MIIFGLRNFDQNRQNVMENQQVSFEQVIDCGCGIDVHKSLLVATIRGMGIKEETREYGVFTEDIELLRGWLKTNKVTHVARKYRCLLEAGFQHFGRRF